MKSKYGNQKLTYQGIEFDSKLELYTYQMFKNEGFNIMRCTESFLLQDKFEVYDIIKGKMKKYREITYTPDFLIRTPDFIIRPPDVKPIVVECKGFPAKDFPLRLKMFLKKFGFYYNYIQIKSQNECLQMIERLKELREERDGKI